MIGFGNSMFLNTSLFSGGGGGGIDPDAQAFITAAAITDPTQQAAINTLVVDLKGYNVWSKMKALYPFVGSTASQHKWNLKDPRDLDAAFRLTFFGGITHSSNGILGNGTNGYFNTHLVSGIDVLKNSNASGIYIRTNVSEENTDYGMFPTPVDNQAYQFLSRNSSNAIFTRNSALTSGSVANTDSRGFFQMTRGNSSNYVVAKGTTKTTHSVSTTAGELINLNLFGLTLNVNGSPAGYSTKQVAFHYYANTSLTNTELDNLYTAVQAFQTTLGRSIGTQTVSDADAQAFVTNAGIVDQVEANAINNLVIGMKADGLWSKMKAVYPFVGGTASSNKFNLKNPLDTDAAFRLVFIGGGTWNNNGYTPNGTNGYANTFLTPSTNLTTDNHISIYLNSLNTAGLVPYIIGCYNSEVQAFTIRTFGTFDNSSVTYNHTPLSISNTSANSDGFWLTNIISSNHRQVRNTTLRGSITKLGAAPTVNMYIGALNNNNVAAQFANQRIATTTIGDNLTAVEESNLYTALQNFNTALARQV